jgi:hypothetical protein
MARAGMMTRLTRDVAEMARTACGRRGLSAVVGPIGRDLFLADLDLHRCRMTADVVLRFGEALYRAALWNGADHKPMDCIGGFAVVPAGAGSQNRLPGASPDPEVNA